MKLIVGLGNPGTKYQGTLHNAGAQVLDLLAHQHFQSTWVKGFKGFYLKENLNNKSVALLKPMTYMNLSGGSVLSCRSFFKIEATQILVLSDDIDLTLGKIRYRTSGGHGGHNGLRNIIELNGNNFHRLRIGIGRPDGDQAVSNYVLSKPSGSSGELLSQVMNRAVGYIMDFIEERPVQVEN